MAGTGKNSNVIYSNQSAAKAQPTVEDLMAQIEALKAQVVQAKAHAAIVYKVTHPHLNETTGKWTTSEGQVSAYLPNRRFPVTLGADEWEMIHADKDNFTKFAKANQSTIVRR